MTQQRKILFISLSIFVLLAIAIVAIYLFTPTTFIKFETAPQQVTVSIDNKQKQTVSNNQSIAISPGNHTIVVSKNDFSTYKKNINIKKNQTYDFLVALTALTNSAKAELQNQQSESVIEHFYGVIMTHQTDIITKKYPILSILPIQARLYSITACPSVKYPNDPTKIALCVDETQSSLQPYVLKDIQSRGFNPADYEIIWSVNPPSAQ